MNYKENRSHDISAGKDAIWELKVALYEAALIRSRTAELKYWRLKVVLN